MSLGEAAPRGAGEQQNPGGGQSREASCLPAALHLGPRHLRLHSGLDLTRKAPLFPNGPTSVMKMHHCTINRASPWRPSLCVLSRFCHRHNHRSRRQGKTQTDCTRLWGTKQQRVSGAGQGAHTCLPAQGALEEGGRGPETRPGACWSHLPQHLCTLRATNGVCSQAEDLAASWALKTGRKRSLWFVAQ